MKINRKDKSKRKRFNEAGRSVESLRCSPRTRLRSGKDETTKQKHMEPKNNKKRTKTTNSKKQSHPSSLPGDYKERLRSHSKARSTSPESSTAGSQIKQPKRMDDSSVDEAVSIQADPYVSDAGAKIIKNIEKKEANIVYLEDEEIIEDGSERDQFMTDFDIMRARKKAESVRRRKRNHNEASDENEDLVVELLLEMQQSATQDRLLNLDGKPATKKIAILHKVMHQLIKKDLQPTLLNHNVLHVLAEWITPLPNKALPCLQIRESVLKLLADFPPIDKFHLKQSGIGKAVMYLYKHPKETKANRKRANALIAEWFRSVFNISTDFSGMSCEERRQRDLQQLPKQHKPSTPPDVVTSASVVLPDFWMFETNKKTIRPGDKGWINRARVPLPSDKVYIVRPKSKIEVNLNSVAKKQPNRYEIYLKKFYDNKRKSSTRPPVPLSIGGAKFCDY